MKKASGILVFSLLLISIIPSLVPASEAFTWDETVKIGNWARYNSTLIIKSSGLVNVEYPSSLKMTIKNVTNSSIDYEASEASGNLGGFFSSGNATNESLIVPDFLLILPVEIIGNETINLGNISLEFKEVQEMDYKKYWRGIYVKKIELDEATISTLLSINITNMLEMIASSITSFTGINVSIVNTTIFMKYDTDTGWLYQMRMEINFMIMGFLPADLALDVSMIEACTEIDSIVKSKKDPALETTFGFQQTLSSQWFYVILLVIFISAFFSIIITLRYLRSRKEARKETKKLLEKKPSKMTVSEMKSKKYREETKGKRKNATCKR